MIITGIERRWSNYARILIEYQRVKTRENQGIEGFLRRAWLSQHNVNSRTKSFCDSHPNYENVRPKLDSLEVVIAIFQTRRFLLVFCKLPLNLKIVSELTQNECQVKLPS